MNNFEEKDYKLYLKTAFESRKLAVGNRVTYQRMADHCGVQKTYLSRVFNGDAQLNEDQCYLAGTYLCFSEEEIEFLLLLHRYNRSKIPQRQKSLLKAIEAREKQKNRTEEHLRTAEGFSDNIAAQAEYYLDMNLQLIHIFLSIARFASHPLKICEALHISKAEFGRALDVLEKLLIVERKGSHIQLLRTDLHISSESPLYRGYRLVQRTRALEKIQSLPSELCYNFSALFSANDATRKNIHQKLLALLSEVHGEVTQAESENVYQLNIDFFPWNT